MLLGHTRDDQAETVLLGLARGSGTRSLAGMAAVRGRYRRPLLDLDRATTAPACAEAGLQPWQDPHNADRAYARVRVRADVLPALEDALGPGVAAALARTRRAAARGRRRARRAHPRPPTTSPSSPPCRRPARPGAQALGRAAPAAPPVTAAHVDALRALVEDWRGQGPVALPGGRASVRRGGGTG